MKATDDELLEYIDRYVADHGYSPSIREICAAFGYASTCSVKLRLDKMRRQGLVTFEDMLPRTVRVV